MVKRYVDGFVIAMKKKNLPAYKKMATLGGNVWMKHGALEYFECIGDDLETANTCGALSFPKMTKAKPDETVIFSFIIYKSKAHRDKVNALVMKDPKMNPEQWKNNMPFEMKKMAMGGFESIVAR